MEGYYKISGRRLSGFADQARRLGSVSGELTPEQIEEVLQGVTCSGQSPFQTFFTDVVNNHIISQMEDKTYQATVTDTIANHILSVALFAPGGILEIAPSDQKYSYNGHVLPQIPADALAAYPYAWIRDNSETGYYDLLMATGVWYRADDYTLNHSDSNKISWYRIEKASAESSQDWLFYQLYLSTGWGEDANRVCVWSNQDIPDGSVEASDIYFEGSTPAPVE